MNSVAYKNTSRNAQVQFSSVIINHIISYFGEMDVYKITPDIIEKYKMLNFENGFKEGTIKTHIDIFKLIINHHYSEKMKENPLSI